MITETASAFALWEIVAVLVGALATYLAAAATRIGGRHRPSPTDATGAGPDGTRHPGAP